MNAGLFSIDQDLGKWMESVYPGLKTYSIGCENIFTMISFYSWIAIWSEGDPIP